MKPLKLWILSAALLFQASGCAVDSIPLRIMPMGDSITYGFNYPGGYRIRLERLLTQAGVSFQFVGSLSNGPAELTSKNNEGHSGWTTKQLLDNAKDWMDNSRPDIVLLMIGTNDVAMTNVSQVPDLVQIKSDLGLLVDRIFETAPQSQIFLATIPPTNAFWMTYVDQLNSGIRLLVAAHQMKKQNIVLVDAAANLTTADMDQRELPVLGHPSAEGYDKIADSWSAVLLPYLK